jgi:hypothetical protein
MIIFKSSWIEGLSTHSWFHWHGCKVTPQLLKNMTEWMFSNREECKSFPLAYGLMPTIVPFWVQRWRFVWMMSLLQCSWKNVWVVYFKSLSMQLIGWYFYTVKYAMVVTGMWLSNLNVNVVHMWHRLCWFHVNIFITIPKYICFYFVTFSFRTNIEYT